MSPGSYRTISDYLKDGYPHIRDMHGTCVNCGASRFEYHYPLKPREVSAHVTFQ